MIDKITKAAFIVAAFACLITLGLMEPISRQMSQELTETLQ